MHHFKRKVGRPRGMSEQKRTELCEELSAFEEFKRDFLPAIKKDLTNKIGAKAILEKYKDIAAARKVMALTSENEEVAVRAAQQILDRTEGKAKESIALTHKYEALSDEELQAKLLSLERETNTIDVTPVPQQIPVETKE